MRKYRGLTKDKDERWIYGWYSYNSKRNIHMITEDNSGTWEVIPETVGQFTGLHDKNSKESYANDLIDIKDGDYCARGVVEWRDGSGQWMWRATNTHNSLTIGENQKIPLWKILSVQHRYKGEIIGNIHEHPDLMKKGK